MRIASGAPPIDRDQTCSPLFISVAVMTLQGGLLIGRPRGPFMYSVGARMKFQLVSAGSAWLSAATITELRVGTNIRPVSGSNAPPFQFALPP